MTRRKFSAIAVMLIVLGFASVTNAGTDVIRDYGADQFKNSYGYAPAPLPPPRPIYYAPPPPRVNVLVFPAYGYCGPRFVGHRFASRRVFVRPHRW